MDNIYIIAKRILDSRVEEYLVKLMNILYKSLSSKERNNTAFSFQDAQSAYCKMIVLLNIPRAELVAEIEFCEYDPDLCMRIRNAINRLEKSNEWRVALSALAEEFKRVANDLGLKSRLRIVY